MARHQTAMQLWAVAVVVSMFGGVQGKCTKCAKAGKIDTGKVCNTVDYTLTMRAPPSTTTLPSVAEFQNTLKTRINSTGSVSCEGWHTPTKQIVCTVADQGGAVNSSTNQIESMRRQALRSELEIGANFRISTFDVAMNIKYPPESPAPGVWAPFITFILFFLILAPFCCFKLLLDESYNAVSKRDQERNNMRIRMDKKEREKAKKMARQNRD